MPQSYRFRWYGPRAEGKLTTAEKRGLLLGAEHILAGAVAIVPIDEDALARSGVASVNDINQAAISFDTPYAVIQHEAMDFRHAPGRQAKYLEVPFNAAQAEVLAIVAAQVRRALQ